MSVIFYAGSEKIYDKILKSASPLQKNAINEAKAILQDSLKCRDAISFYNNGIPEPHFSVVRPDIQKISDFLPFYSNKKNINDQNNMFA